MTAKERVLKRERERGRAEALDLAMRAATMTGTELIDEEEKVPSWNEKKTYTENHIGYPVRDGDHIYTISQAHNPADTPGMRPSDLQDIYIIKHTQKKEKAKPYKEPKNNGFYMTGDVCISDGKVWRSTKDKNKTKPGKNKHWEEVEP